MKQKSKKYTSVILIVLLFAVLGAHLSGVTDNPAITLRMVVGLSIGLIIVLFSSYSKKLMLQINWKKNILYLSLFIFILVPVGGIGYIAGFLHQGQIQEEIERTNFLNAMFSLNTLANAMYNSSNYYKAKHAYIYAKDSLIMGSNLRSIEIEKNPTLTYHLAIINYRLSVIEKKQGNDKAAQSYLKEYKALLDRTGLRHKDDNEAIKYMESVADCLGVMQQADSW